MNREKEIKIKENESIFNSKLPSVIVDYAFIATFLSIFVLNNNSSLSTYPTTRLINLILTLILLGLLFISAFDEIKLYPKMYLLLFATIVISLIVLFVRSYVNFHWIYLCYIVFMVSSDIKINIKVKKYVVYLSFLFVVYQLATFRFLGTVPVLSWIDPNYSGYYIFMFSIFSKNSGFKKISVALILLGLLTLSRTYILAIIIFLLFDNIEYLKQLVFKFKLAEFFRLMIISLVVVMIIGSLFIASDKKRSHFSDRGIERIFSVDDLSNLYRFTANKKFADSILSNPSYYFFGVNTVDYQFDVFMNTPHNSFLALIVNYGIFFAFPFILIYGMSFNKLFTKDNVPLIISHFIFYSFLGAGIQGFPGLLLFYTLREKGISSLKT